MKNPGFTRLDQYRDVESLNAMEIMKNRGIGEKTPYAILAMKSRDNARTPMRWNTGPHGGFTTGTPWIESPEDGELWNARAQQADPDSVFHHNQKLIRLRKEHPAISRGSISPVLEDHPAVVAYRRHAEAEEALVLTYLSQSPARITLEDVKGFQPVLSSYPDFQEILPEMELRPYESLICFREVQGQETDFRPVSKETAGRTAAADFPAVFCFAADEGHRAGLGLCQHGAEFHSEGFSAPFESWHQNNQSGTWFLCCFLSEITILVFRL